MARDPGLPRAALWLLLLVFVWAPDAAIGTGVFWYHDLRHHHYPWRVWAAGEWASGHIPIWCSQVANGYPLMADGQTGALYPVTMGLFLLLPDTLAMNWAILLHYWWAGLGMFLLARSLGRSELASFFAALAFIFSGFVVTHTLYLGMLNSLAWLPFTLFAVVRATDGAARPAAARRWWVALSVGLWFMFVAGHIQIAVYGWLLTGMFLLWRIYPAPFSGRELLRPLLAFALAVLAAVALSSPQIAATWELTRFSMRDGGVASGFATIGSLPPQELINGILPRFFGFDRPVDIQQTYYHRGTGYWGLGENYWEMAFYLGIPVLLLSTWAIFSRAARFWKLLAILALLLMLGGYTPVYKVFRLLPGMGYFRFPARFALWLTLAVDMLAAIGLDLLMNAYRRSRREAIWRWMRRSLLFLLMAILALASLDLFTHLAETPIRSLLTDHFQQQVEAPAPPEGLGPLEQASLPSPEPEDPRQIPAKVERIIQSLRSATSPLSPNVVFPAGLVLSLLGATWLLIRNKLSTYAFGMVCSALLFLDLYAFGGQYHPRVPVDAVGAAPTFLQALAEPRSSYRVTVVDRRVDPVLDSELASASLGILWGLNDVIVTSPLLMVRNELYLGMAGLDIGSQRGRIKVDTMLEHMPLVNRLGLRYLLTTHEIDDPRLRMLQGGAVKLYENLQVLPMAQVVGCARVVDGANQAYQALADLDTSSEAVLELVPPVESLPPDLVDCEAGPIQGMARIVSSDSRSWRIDVSTNRSGLLVLSESWYPGWVARLDGAVVPIHTVDLIFRGVVIPPGDHRVSMDYRPSWLLPTATLMGLGLLGLVVTLLWGCLGPRPPEPG